ncbi:MAG: class I SAM-dependent methyltransferase [Thermoplasmata archaeon]|nr:class I SAM-dependent methyltransferase [Thermoplasmata archaeon]
MPPRSEPRGGLAVRRSSAGTRTVGAPRPTDRFRNLDRYRVDREWARYEGTAQRELFRTLRERFLARHVGAPGWAVDIGSGSGRFTARLGGPESRRVAVDLSEEMLLAVPEHWPEGVDVPHRVRADGRSPPLRPGCAVAVGLLGNAVGFAGGDALDLLDRCAELVAPGGQVLVEAAPGAGTSARYLHRLPSGAVRRLLHAPVRAIQGRVLREGFVRLESPDRTRHGFRPVSAGVLSERLAANGFEITESGAVAPGLGSDPARLEAVRADPVAWQRLLELEERLGTTPVARDSAAALLVAAVRRDDASKIQSVK